MKNLIGYAVAVGLGVELLVAGSDSIVIMFNNFQDVISEKACEISGGEYCFDLPHVEFDAEKVVNEYEGK